MPLGGARMGQIVQLMIFLISLQFTFRTPMPRSIVTGLVTDAYFSFLFLVDYSVQVVVFLLKKNGNTLLVADV